MKPAKPGVAPALPRQIRPVLPDVDIWIKAFSRQQPDPLVVHAFKLAVERRQIFMIGLVRQALLARTTNDGQLMRLSQVLGGFPDLPIHAADHVAAARRIQAHRSRRLVMSPWQAVLWSLAERTGAMIWSQAQHWSPLIANGCPASTSITAAH
jgi:hypothetical protein